MVIYYHNVHCSSHTVLPTRQKWTSLKSLKVRLDFSFQDTSRIRPCDMTHKDAPFYNTHKHLFHLRSVPYNFPWSYFFATHCPSASTYNFLTQRNGIFRGGAFDDVFDALLYFEISHQHEIKNATSSSKKKKINFLRSESCSCSIIHTKSCGISQVHLSLRIPFLLLEVGTCEK